jgi:hypothetical protein
VTETGRRFNDLPSWIQALAALLSVLVAIAALVLTRPEPSSGGTQSPPSAAATVTSGATPSASATTGPTPSGSAGPSASGGASFPSPAEEALLLHVPANLRTACARAEVQPGQMLGALAVLDCYPRAADAPDAVRYASFPDILALDAIFEQQVRYAADSVTGDSALCMEPPHTGGAGDYNRAEKRAGRLLCHQDRESAILAWSYEPVRIYAAAVRADGDAAKLFAWWSDGGRAGPLD